MIRILTLAFLILIINACNKSEDILCIPKQLQSNIVSFYPFSNGSLDDKSGNGFSLVNPNNISPFEDRVGKNGCAYIFDGSTDQYLSRHGKFLDDFHKSNFSVSMWYKPLDTRDGGDYELLMGRVENYNIKKPNKSEQWSIGLYDCRLAIFHINRKACFDDFPPIPDSITVNSCDFQLQLLSNVWHHLVVTFDGKKRQIFRNSIQAGGMDDGFRFGSMSKNLGDFFIGKGFKGIIDDIIIFNKVLTQDEVNDLYNLEPCCQ